VTADSPAYSCGLRAGDIVLSAGSKDISGLAQKAASDIISKSGNEFSLIVKRCGTILKIKL